MSKVKKGELIKKGHFQAFGDKRSLCNAVHVDLVPTLSNEMAITNWVYLAKMLGLTVIVFTPVQVHVMRTMSTTRTTSATQDRPTPRSKSGKSQCNLSQQSQSP